VAVLSRSWRVREGSSRSGLQLWWWLSLVPAPLPPHGGTVMTSPKGRNQLQQTSTLRHWFLRQWFLRLFDYSTLESGPRKEKRRFEHRFHRFLALLLECLERWLCTSAVSDFDTSTLVSTTGSHFDVLDDFDTWSFPSNYCCAGVFLLVT